MRWHTAKVWESLLLAQSAPHGSAAASMMLSRVVAILGPLRTALGVLTLITAGAAPFAGGEVHYTGWRLFPSVIAPTFMLTLLFVLPLDALMARIFMSDADATQRGRYRAIIRIELVLFILLLLAWSPIIFALLRA